MNFTSQESHCAQLKLYIQTSQQNECCSVSPAFLSRDVHFVITTVDSPGQEEGGGGGKEEEEREGKRERRSKERERGGR